MKVVFLAFEFPPLASGGVYRPLAFAKYLPQHGIDLDVVSVDPQDYARWSPASLDWSLLRDVPDTVTVHRLRSGFPDWYWKAASGRLGFRLLQLAYWGDPVSSFWKRTLIPFLDRLFAETRPDVLLATMPPFGVGPMAVLAARRYGVPLVLDWRDPWSRWVVGPFPSWAHYRYIRAIERRLLEAATVSISTTQITRDDWLEDFPNLDPSRLRCIPNGYDCLQNGAKHPHPGDGRLVISHLGSFYYTPEANRHANDPWYRRLPHRWLHYRPRREDWLYRSPYFFLRGLRRFLDDHPEWKQRTEVCFAGASPRWLPAMLRETRTTQHVTCLGFLEREKARALIRRSSALLMTSVKVIGGRDYVVGGKCYEYMAHLKPILAPVSEGATRDVLAGSGLALLADPDDERAIAEAIHRVALSVESGALLVKPNLDYIRQYDRSILAGQMADVLRLAAGQRAPVGHAGAARRVWPHDDADRCAG